MSNTWRMSTRRAVWFNFGNLRWDIVFSVRRSIRIWQPIHGEQDDGPILRLRGEVCFGPGNERFASCADGDRDIDDDRAPGAVLVGQQELELSRHLGFLLAS